MRARPGAAVWPRRSCVRASLQLWCRECCDLAALAPGAGAMALVGVDSRSSSCATASPRRQADPSPRGSGTRSAAAADHVRGHLHDRQVHGASRAGDLGKRGANATAARRWLRGRRCAAIAFTRSDRSRRMADARDRGVDRVDGEHFHQGSRRSSREGLFRRSVAMGAGAMALAGGLVAAIVHGAERAVLTRGSLPGPELAPSR